MIFSIDCTIFFFSALIECEENWIHLMIDKFQAVNFMEIIMEDKKLSQGILNKDIAWNCMVSERSLKEDSCLHY